MDGGDELIKFLWVLARQCGPSIHRLNERVRYHALLGG
jgi:hypothetical protein